MSTLAEQARKIETAAQDKPQSMIWLSVALDGLEGSIDTGPQLGKVVKIGPAHMRKLLRHVNLNCTQDVCVHKDGWHLILFVQEPLDIRFWSRLIYGQDMPILFEFSK